MTDLKEIAAAEITAPEGAPKMTAHNVNVFYGEKQAIRDVSIDVSQENDPESFSPSTLKAAQQGRECISSLLARCAWLPCNRLACSPADWFFITPPVREWKQDKEPADLEDGQDLVQHALPHLAHQLPDAAGRHLAPLLVCAHRQPSKAASCPAMARCNKMAG